MIETVFLLIFCSGAGDSRTCATPYEFKSEKLCQVVLNSYKDWARVSGQCIRVTRKKERE